VLTVVTVRDLASTGIRIKYAIFTLSGTIVTVFPAMHLYPMQWYAHTVNPWRHRGARARTPACKSRS